MLNKMNFENYNDYLLSLNISQISREFGFKKVGINSLYLITHLTRNFIEQISSDAQKVAEESNRIESNLIDLFYSLEDNKISQENLKKYIKDSKIKYDFSKGNYIRKIFHTEERERNSHIRKINSNQVHENLTLNDKLLKAIPAQLRYFPKEYLESEEIVQDINIQNEQVEKKVSENKGNVNEHKKNEKVNRKESLAYDKKNMDELNNALGYFDMSKKHTRKKISFDITKVFNEVSEEDHNIMLGKKVKREDKAETGTSNKIISIYVGNNNEQKNNLT